MPLLPSSRKVGITVVEKKLSGTITDFSVAPSKAVPGDKIAAGGYISFNDYVSESFDMVLYCKGADGRWYEATRATISPATVIPPDTPYGFSVYWTLPKDFHGKKPCQTWEFKVKEVTLTGAESGTASIKVGYPTEITISAPSQVNVGETFTIKATLKNKVTGAGIGGKTLTFKILKGGTVVKETTKTTNASGVATWSTSIGEKNSYDIVVSFAGENWGSSSLSVLGIRVGEVQGQQLALIAIGAGILAAGFIGWYIWQQLQREY